jgi:predicted nucleic acid-binding protein
VRYLADSSIWGWALDRRRPDLAEALARRLEADEIATCAPVALEVLHRARTGAEYEDLFATYLAPLHWLSTSEQAAERALDVQRRLAGTTDGNHRRPAVDYLIAATAEAAGGNVALWFLDRDLEVICGHTGQPHEAEIREDTGASQG